MCYENFCAGKKPEMLLDTRDCSRFFFLYSKTVKKRSSYIFMILLEVRYPVVYFIVSEEEK